MPCKSKFFGPRAKKFRRAETTSGGSLGPLKKRAACQNHRYSHPSVFAIMTDHESEGSGVENEPLKRQNLVLFTRSKTASKNRGKICIWSNDAVGGKYFQFALANSKISQETREVYNTLQESKHSTRGFDLA